MALFTKARPSVAFAAACALGAAAGAARASVVLDAGDCPDDVEFIEKAGFMKTLEEKMPKVLALMEGREAAESPIPDVKFILVKDFPGSNAAATARPFAREIRLGTTWAKTQSVPEVNGALVHEFAHIVQSYGKDGRKRPPSWVSEGVVDWVRWFNFEPPERSAFIAREAARVRRHDYSYRVTAAFFDWIAKKYDPDFVIKLNKICRAGEYDDVKTWIDLLGKPQEVLASEWRDSLPPVRKPAGAINLASYNIRRAGKPDVGERDWTNRVHLVAGVVEKRGFEVMGLQEAYPRQIVDLRAALPGWDSFGKGRFKDFSDEASPIFWKTERFEKLDGGQFWLSETPDEPGSKSWKAAFPRVCTWVKLHDKKTGRDFFFFNTHLDHASIEARQNGVKVILGRIAEIAKGAPVVLSGDFNDAVVDDRLRAEIRNHPKDRTKLTPAGPDHPINVVKAVLKDTEEISKQGHLGTEWTDNTYGEKHIKRIDYVFVSDGIDVFSHETCCDRPNGMYPSDHEAVAVTLLLK